MRWERSTTGWARVAVAVLLTVLGFSIVPSARAAGASAAAPAGQLVPTAAELAAFGLRAVSVDPVGLASGLAAGLPAADRTLLAGAGAQAVGGRSRGGQITFAAFVMPSAAGAARVLRDWERVGRASSVAIAAAGGSSASGSRRRTVATVLWRHGFVLGYVSVRAGRSTAASLASEYARLEDSRLGIAPPTTALDRLSAQIRPDGTVSKQTALQVFALLYGSVPGVRTPSGPRGVALSGDLAAGWILPYLPHLNAAQRRVVARHLGIRLGRVARAARTAPGVPVAHAACLYCDYGDPTFTEDALLQATADHWVSEYGSTALGPLGMTVVVGTASIPKKAPASLFADAAAMNDADGAIKLGPPSICRIRMFPAAVGAGSLGESWILAHEVFHCFEYRILGAGTWDSAPGAWVMEGLATWAAFEVDPVNFAPAVDKILQYIGDPQKSLFQRDYDAVGFWLHLEDVDHGPYWSQIPGVITGGSTTADFAASGANTSPFWDSWGSSVLRAVTGDLDWDMPCPCDHGAALGFVPGFGALKPGGFESLSGAATVYAGSYGTSQYQFDDPGPIVHVGISGYARLSTMHDYVDFALHDAWFCIEPGPCVCPPGEMGKVPPTQPLEPMALLGLSGAPLTGTQGSVKFYTLDDFCKPPPPPGPSPPSGGNSGISNGDPHMTTFSGVTYNFQTAGEFTLAKSTTDNLEIQSRQQPYPAFSGLGRYLAMNTAFAMRDGRAIVELDKGSPLVLYIDHRRRHPRAGQVTELPGGGAVRYGPVRTYVSWRDGTVVQVLSIGAAGVNIAVTPSARREGHLRGLLGADDGQPADDFIGRNGIRYPIGQFQGGGLVVDNLSWNHLVVSEFGRSWRITQRESLFVYPPGKNTNSYLVPGFPAKFVTLHSLPAARVVTAQQICAAAGITNQGLLNGCEIDVAATGNHTLATSTGAVQHAVPHLNVATGNGVTLSPIPWTQLSTRTDSSYGTPTIGLAGGQVVVAARRATDQAIEAATFAPTASGVSGLSQTVPFSGWLSTLDPMLLPSAGGGLQMILAGQPSSDFIGTVLVPRNADGSFGTPVTLTSMSGYGPTGAVLAADGTTPLWTSPWIGYSMFVFAGGVMHDLTSDAPGGVFGAPTLGRDASGRVWLAFYGGVNTASGGGLYMMQLDPQTGLPVGPPVLAPDSSPSGAFALQISMPCAQQCRLVYAATGLTTEADYNIVSWAPGERAPVIDQSGLIGNAQNALGDVVGAYAADGRLWVAFNASEEPGAEFAKLGDANGFGGTLVQLPKVKPLVRNGFDAPGPSVAVTVGDQLVLATLWNDGLESNSTSVWGTVVNPQ